MVDDLYTGISGLISYQQALSTTGHNIANADTVGYSRQRTLFTTQTPQNMGTGWVGSGVRVLAVERQYDDFLATQTRNTQSAASNLEAFTSYAVRVDSLLANPDVGMDPAIQRFFDSMQALADSPDSVPARQLMLSESQAMADRFHYLDGQFEELRDQTNKELAAVTTEINGLTNSIAEVNQHIIEAIGVSGGADPNDLLDQRQTLLNELSKLVDIKTVPQDDGALNVFIGKGQAMVMGSNASTLGLVPNANDPSKREVIFTDTVGSQAITQSMTGGEIGGLLSFHEQILDPAQNRLGLIAVGISDQINQQHQLGVDLNGDLGGRVFNQPVIEVRENSYNNPASTVSVTATFTDTGHLTASDYVLKADDAAGNFTLTRLSDGHEWSIAAGATPYTHDVGETDGFSITIDSGLAGAQSGDEFLIRPTRNAARDLALEVIDPLKLTAAGVLRSEVMDNANTGGPNLGNASVSQPTVSDVSTLDTATSISMVYDAANKQFQLDVDMDGDGNPDTLAYDPAIDSGGRSYQLSGDYGDPAFSVSGDPQDGDSYLITFNQGGVGDNRNALQMAQMQHDKTMLGDSSSPGNESATFQDVYGLLVTDVGSRTRTSQINAQATNGLLERHQMAMSSISGVNLDEEAADLIRYQQAYQAAAQVISTANNMFNTLLGAIRG